MQAFIKLAAVAATAAALAFPEKRASVAFTDTFDDLTSNIAVPQLFPVGQYNGLAYGGVVVLRPFEGITSARPHSGEQHAGAAGPIDLVQLGELTLNTFATINRDSNTKSFDISSFWFGFGTDTVTTSGLAQPGTLHVVAYDVNDRQIPASTFSYVPDSSINAPLTLAQLNSDYKNLKNITFAVASSEPVSERTYIALDDVAHVNDV